MAVRSILGHSLALVCTANGLIFGSGFRKDTQRWFHVSSLLVFSICSKARGLQLHHLKATNCEPTGNFNLVIICACRIQLHLVFAHMCIHRSTATSHLAFNTYIRPFGGRWLFHFKALLYIFGASLLCCSTPYVVDLPSKSVWHFTSPCFFYKSCCPHVNSCWMLHSWWRQVVTSN